jgi:hypothetical protein
MTKKQRHSPAEMAAPQVAKPEVRILLNDPEKGTSGLQEWMGFVNEAYLAELYWPTCGPLYRRIETACPEIVITNRTFTTWGRNLKPFIDLPEDPSDDDKRYRDFVLSDFENMEGGFGSYIEQVMRTAFEGWTWFTICPSLRNPEWVPPDFVDYNNKKEPDDWRSEEDDGLIGIRRLAYRDSLTMDGWDMNSQKKTRGLWQSDFPYGRVLLPLRYDPKTGNAGSLHQTFGDPNNPEGTATLQAIYRLENIRKGLEIIYGIGSEHAAGYFQASKTEAGTLSDDDRRNIGKAAAAVLTAQEGNYVALPYGIEGKVVDVPFSAAGSILEASKHYSILMFSVYMMQFMALNTMTNTGAMASQVDSTSSALFAFNAMMDGFAQQLDNQIGKRLYQWNKDSFPGLTKRPKIRFSHIENNIDLGALGSLLGAINGIIPLGADDMKAFRSKIGFIPTENPEDDDILLGPGAKKEEPPAQPVMPFGATPPPMPPEDMTPEEQAAQTAGLVAEAMRVFRAHR